MWALSLMLSVVLVASGERWPQPLRPDPVLALALVSVPPLLMLLWLAFHWRLPASQQAGPGDRGQSQHPEAMEP